MLRLLQKVRNVNLFLENIVFDICTPGFARVQNEHPQQPTVSSYNQLPFVPRYPMPCYSSSGPPQMPIAPPIQRGFSLLFLLLTEQTYINFQRYLLHHT